MTQVKEMTMRSQLGRTRENSQSQTTMLRTEIIGKICENNDIDEFSFVDLARFPSIVLLEMHFCMLTLLQGRK